MERFGDGQGLAVEETMSNVENVEVSIMTETIMVVMNVGVEHGCLDVKMLLDEVTKRSRGSR